MLGRLRIRTKLAVLVAVPVVALILTAVLGWTTLQDTKVLGPRYDSIKTSQGLIADVMPPPDNVMESYLVAYQMLGADGHQRDALAQRFDGLRKAFEDGHTYWSTKLTAPSDAALRASFLGAAYNAGHDFFQVAVSQFEPAIARDDVVAARSVLDTTMADAYTRHHAAIEQTLTLALEREQQSEKAADKFVSSRTLTLVSMFFGILALATLLGIYVARAITRSIERIRDRATDVAVSELPNLMLQIDALHEHDEIPKLPPITVGTKDELGELAVALTTLQDTAVRLAAEQAVVRRNVSDVFVSLGRRNQGLLTRQLSFITDLEREQTDDDVLADLFRLDHLATRMRRNAESLLVLAGAEPTPRVHQPMAVADAVRAALSEIEDYSRVDFGDIEAMQLKGTVVTDAAHMLAELLENAATFSGPDTRVEVIGRITHDGYLLTIVDHGIGMESEMLMEANRRISKVTPLDRAPSKVLGLYVVGRLAKRHGIAVFLSDTPGGGVTAKVVVPARLLQGHRGTEPASEDTGQQLAFEVPKPPAPIPIPVVVAAPEPEPAPEPAVAEIEPEPVVAEIEPEPVVAEIEPEPEPHTFAALADAFPVEVESAAIVAEPVEVVAIEPEPVEVAAIEPEPVEIAAIEPELVEVEPVEVVATEPEPVEVAATEPEPVEAAAEPEPVEVAAEPEPVVAADEPEPYPFAAPADTFAADALHAPAPVEAVPVEAVADEPVSPEPEPWPSFARYSEPQPEPQPEPETEPWPSFAQYHESEPQPAPQPEPEPEPQPVAEERPSFAISALDAYSFTPPRPPEPQASEPDAEPEPSAVPNDSWWPAAWEQHEPAAEADDQPVHEVQPVAQDTATATALLDAPTEAPAVLPRRVRGAQLPDTGPTNRPADTRVRSAEDVRNSLNRFRAGVKRGRDTEETTHEGDD